MRQHARINGPELVRATADNPELLQQITLLKNWEIREAAITHGIDVGQKHVGSRQGLGEAQVGRQDLIRQMLEKGVKPEEILQAAKQPVKTVPIEQLREGDTFVDKTGEPRRIVEITPGGKIRTADGTALTFQGGIEIRGELNSMRAQLARGGKFIEGTETEVDPDGSTVRLRNNPLEVKGTGKGGKIMTTDLLSALNDYTRRALGKLPLGKATREQMIERGTRLAEDEAKYQLAQDNNGAAWYTLQMKAHDAIVRAMRPALRDPVNLSLFKMAEAILSSGQKPYRNLKATIQAWDIYAATGEFSPVNPKTGKSWGPRSKAGYGNAFDALNELIHEYEPQGAVDWLLKDHPIHELREYNNKVPGSMDDELPGTMIFGDKRGPFALNLHGIESAFTADMWVSRTWNRWMGTLDTRAAAEEDISTDAPRNNAERALMREVFERTAEKLGMTTSALQAVLWYYEQALYTAHGVPKESWSFSDAAERLRDEEAGKATRTKSGRLVKPQPAGRAP